MLDSAATSVLANDTDADLPNDLLTSIGTGPAFASGFTLNTDGTFSYTHDGSENFTDSFTYIVSGCQWWRDRYRDRLDHHHPGQRQRPGRQ
ncbi:MAG: Ig-like domain-containing protein [Burkholderiaceae bacterium]